MANVDTIDITKLILVEQGSTPSSPSAGKQKLFVRSSDHLLCIVDSSGTVTPYGGALTNPMSAVGDLIRGGTAGAPTALAAVATGKVLSSKGVTTAPAWDYPPFHGARVTDTSGQTIVNNTLTALAFAGTETYDPDGWHSTVTNNTRITPTIAGKYSFGGTVALASGSATGFRLIGVRLNGSTYLALDERPGYASAATEQYISISTEGVMNGSTDYAELIYRQTTGGSVGLSVNADYGCQFYASLIGV